MSEHAHAEAETVSEEMHDGSWSVNLETPEYEDDPDRTIADAIAAIEHTRPGFHVNLVTHGANGHPETYLFAALEDEFDDVDYEYVEQCGCGGHVTRVHR